MVDHYISLYCDVKGSFSEEDFDIALMEKIKRENNILNIDNYKYLDLNMLKKEQ